MNAVADVLSRQSLFAKTAAVSICAIAWVMMLRPQIDPDFWWHLRVADYVHQTGDVPRTDFLSWQAFGEPWIAHSWLHDLLMSTAFDVGGLSAVGVIGALMAAVVVVLAYRLFVVAVPDSVPVVWAAGTAAVALVGGPVWSPRAQVWDVIFLTIAVIGWIGYRDGSRVWLFAMVPLGAAWSALHGSGIGAYVVSALALAVAVAFGWLPAGRSRLMLAASVLGTIVAMAIGPYGFELLRYPFETIFSPTQARLIDEWAAPDLGDVRFIGIRVALIAIPVLFLLGRRLPDLLIGLLALGWGWLALGSARYLALAAPFLVASVVPSVEAIRARLLRHQPSTARSPLIAALAVLAVVPICVGVGWTRISPSATDAAIAERYPVAATAALIDLGCTGRIWNQYDWGGYLAYRWRQPVGAYGAADSLGDARLEAYAQQAAGGDAFLEALTDNDVRLAMVAPGGPPAQQLASHGWNRVGGDKIGELWARPGACA